MTDKAMDDKKAPEKTIHEIDVSNLRFYASLFRELQWQTDVLHWSVFEHTLLHIAERIAALTQQLAEARADAKQRKAEAVIALEVLTRIATPEQIHEATSAILASRTAPQDSPPIVCPNCKEAGLGCDQFQCWKYTPEQEAQLRQQRTAPWEQEAPTPPAKEQP